MENVKKIWYYVKHLILFLGLTICGVGSVYKAMVNEAHFCEYGEWQTLKEATCEEEGKMIRYCNLDSSHAQKKGISITGHHYEDFSCKDCYIDQVSEGLEYVKIENGLRIVGIGTCNDVDVAIPQEIEGKEVVEIAENAFSHNKGIRKLKIPDSVTSIGEGAFSCCTSLTSVVIGDSVTSIGSSAFYDCYGLISVEIPDSVTSIGDWAFFGCPIEKATVPTLAIDFIPQSNLKEITVTSGDTIGERAFYYCDSLTSVEIGDSVTSIGDWAFSYCTSLTSVVIGDSVTSIGSSAFYYCYGLISVEIPDSVTSIGYEAFYWCYRLVEVYNKSSLTITAGSSSNGYVGDYAKNVYTPTSGSSKLSNDNGYVVYTDGEEKILVGYNGKETDLTLPSYITQIYRYAFNNCRSLTSVEIPDNVTSIGSHTFSSCSSLTRIEIPNSVTSIGDWAFFGCSSLTEVYYKGTAEEWDRISVGSTNSSLTSATRYYYRESGPTVDGNYWRYVDGVPTAW